MKKRATALVLAMSMVLAGCSGGNAAQETTTAKETETQAATQAAETESAVQETEAEEDKDDQSYDQVKEADVIIVGAGGAGLAAAIAAADEGADSIIIVEKLAKTGGSLNFTSGSMSGAETIIQELDGIEDTKESYIQDILSNGAQLGDKELIQIFVDEDVDAIQWLWDHGLSEYTFSDRKSVV